MGFVAAAALRGPRLQRGRAEPGEARLRPGSSSQREGAVGVRGFRVRTRLHACPLRLGGRDLHTLPQPMQAPAFMNDHVKSGTLHKY